MARRHSHQSGEWTLLKPTTPDREMSRISDQGKGISQSCAGGRLGQQQWGYVPCGEAFLLGEDETTLYGNRQLALEAEGCQRIVRWSGLRRELGRTNDEVGMGEVWIVEVWIVSRLLRSEKEPPTWWKKAT